MAGLYLRNSHPQHRLLTTGDTAAGVGPGNIRRGI